MDVKRNKSGKSFWDPAVRFIQAALTQWFFETIPVRAGSAFYKQCVLSVA